MANTVIRLGFLSITTGGGAGFEEYANLAAFPLIGQAETIYVALDTNKTYRWSGSTYVEISPSEVISVNSKVGVVVLTKSDIGLSNVDNTSDANKPISNATQAALDLITDVNWTGDYNNGVTYNVGDGVMYNGASFRMVSFIGAAGYIPPAYPANWVQVTDYVSPNDIGLGNVDNTSDLDKPISNDTQDALDLKVDKAGDTMTGQLVMQDSSILVDYTTTNSIPTTIEIENDLIQSTVINGDITTSSNITSKSHTLVRTDVSTLTADKTVQLGGDDVYTILTATVNNTVDNYNTNIILDEIGLNTQLSDGNTGDIKLGTYTAGTSIVQTNFADGTAVTVSSNETGLSLTNYDGFNTIPFTPTQPEHATTKKYVDDEITSINNNKVDRAGDTMTGPLNMSDLSENIEFSIYGLNATQNIEIKSSDDPTRPTGNVTLKTGDASGSDAAGAIYLQGGSNVDGNPGNILLTAGQSSGTGSDGVIVLDAKGVVYLNDNPAGTIDAGSHRIQNVEDPVSDQDAATRKWVDEMSAIDNVLFVSPNANAFIADGSLNRPYATIAAALAVAVDNNVIALLPGTYSEPTVVIPSTLSYLVIQGVASTSTVITNGISYTPGASSIDLLIQKVNIGVLSLDASSALNGLVTLKQVITGYNRQDSNSNVFMITTESTCFSGVIKGGGNNFSECLMAVSLDIESGALVIFENTKFVGYLEVYGSAIVRLLDCELFGAPYFVNGSIDFGNTPTIEIDTASDYLGSLNGDFTKVLLAVIPLENLEAGAAVADQYIKFDGANWVPAYLDAYITNYTPNLNSDWLTVPAVVSEGLDELASRVTTLDGEIIATDTIFQDMKEPTGFVNRTDSEISFDNLTRIFTVQPTGASFSVYHLGVKTTISTSLSITIPDTSGNYYIFINNLGNLTYTTTFDLALISEYAYCAYIYWDDVDNKAVIFGDERHGITMDGTTHAYLHTTRGTQLVSGAAIGYTLGTGALDADAQISLGDMQIKDEDITVNINNDATPDAPFEQILFPIAEIPIVYREGAIWKKSVATQFPMIVQSGDVRASYNEFTGLTWQLTEAPSNNKTLVTYIFATTSVEEPVIGILGQTQYNNIDEARGAASWENINFGDLPSPEMKLLYTLYYDTSSGYANAAKSKITYVADLRFTHDREVSAAVFNSDHANLSGLANDDHTQYHNDARGDARYNLKSTGDISETSFSILNNQSSAQPITGFSFSNATVRSFTALASVKIEATSNLYEVFEIKGIQKDSDWNISIQSSGDISGVSFYISSLGQMEYTSSNYTGFISGVIKFKAFTTSV